MTTFIGWFHGVVDGVDRLPALVPQAAKHPKHRMNFDPHKKDENMGGSGKNRGGIKQSVIKELQSCYYAVGMNMVYSMNQMSNAGKRQALYNLVHENQNDEDSVELLQKLTEGSGEFVCMFEEVNVEVNDSTVFMLKLKDCLLRDPLSPPL